MLDHSTFYSSELSHATSNLDRPTSRDVERELAAAALAVRSAADQMPAAVTLAHQRLEGCIAVSQSI